MKKIILFAAFVFCIAFAAQAQDSWVSQQLTPKVSVKFPFAPKIVRNAFFTSAEKDSSTAYVAFSLEAKQTFGIDSADLVEEAVKPEFAEQFKTGMQSTMPGVQLSDVTIGKWHNYVSYTTSGIDKKGQRYDMFLFFTGDRVYGFITHTKNPAVLTGRDKFIASISLN
jgi:hypothetical protein